MSHQLARMFEPAADPARRWGYGTDAVIEAAIGDGAAFYVDRGEVFIARKWTAAVDAQRAIHQAAERRAFDAKLANDPAFRADWERGARIALDVDRQNQAERAAAIQAERAALSKEPK